MNNIINSSGIYDVNAYNLNANKVTILSKAVDDLFCVG